MKRGQRGAIELMVASVVAAIAVAAFGGLWAYYAAQLRLLRNDVAAKSAAITEMATEKAECTSSVTALMTANQDWVGQVNKCRVAVADIGRERDDKAAEAKKAKEAAWRASVEHKKKIVDILNQTAGVDWCKTWDRMVTDYTVMRQAK